MTRAPDGVGMRIAYFTEWGPHEETGVLRKLLGQVEAWRRLGAEVRIFALATRRDAPPALDFADHGDVIGAIPQRMLDKFPVARLGYFNKIASVPAIRRAIRRFAPDVIYYRQHGPWYPGLGSILSLAPAVIEINTNEDAERSHWGKAFSLLYGATQGRVLASAAGFVAVTGEIGDRYRHLGKPLAVVANSFWGTAERLPATGHAAPAFVFVGSRLTGDSSWHGVDKVLALARAMPASRFHIVGMSAEDFPGETIPPNMELHGVRTGPDLTAIFARSDVGIGTLAFYRKAMEEGCPLKVRDYLMHGLPVILGYREAQPELNHADYVLRIPNTEDNIVTSLDQIAGFAAAWTNRRVEADLGFLSAKAIEARRLEFLREIAA